MKKSLNLLKIAKGSVIRVPLLPFIGVGPLLGCLEESRALITDHDDPNEALMSRNARDDKNGRFGERAPQLTMLAKLAILAIFGQFRQIS